MASTMKALSQLSTAKDLSEYASSLRRGRARLERDWKLNLAYYRGNQYKFYNPRSGRIESLAVQDGEKPRYRVRIVSNQIAPGVHSLLSKFTKTKPVWGASPGDGSDKSLKAAEMSEALLDYWWSDLNMSDKLAEAITWSLLAGNGYWKISWDAHAGKPMRFLLDPMGRPILNNAIEEEFRAELDRAGIRPEEKIVYMGELRIDAFSPFDVYGDPLAKRFEDGRFAICVHHLDPDEVFTRWGVRVKPDAVTADPTNTLPMRNAEAAKELNVKRVWIGYFRPTPALPNGRYVAWCENPEQVLADGPWPYPVNMLPVVQFPGIRVPGSIYDDAVVTHARPLQKELNRTLSQIIEYKNLTIKPRVWAPIGSLRQRLTTEPGNVYEYKPIGDHRPEIERLPAMPPYVFEHLKDVSSRIRDQFSLTEVTEGSVPPNVEAGIAIDLLQEMATDRIAPTVALMEDALSRGGQIMLTLAQRFYQEPRLMKIKGSSGSIQVKRFSQADIAGNITIHVEAGSGLPRTRAGRQARILKLMEIGVIPPNRAYKYLDLADLKGIDAQMRADEDQAYREHDKIIKGIPLNPEAMQAAMMAVNSGINPDTGEPLESPEEAMMILERAALTPGVADVDIVHSDVHGNYIKSIEFENHSPDVRRRFLTHFQLTEQKIASKAPQPEPQAPKINAQLKGTLTPTSLAAIFRQAGMPIDPAVFVEEPTLETWVSDDLDEPDMDSSSGLGQDDADVRLKEAKAREAEAKADKAEKEAKAPARSPNTNT